MYFYAIVVKEGDRYGCRRLHPAKNFKEAFAAADLLPDKDPDVEAAPLIISGAQLMHIRDDIEHYVKQKVKGKM